MFSILKTKTFKTLTLFTLFIFNFVFLVHKCLKCTNCADEKIQKLFTSFFSHFKIGFFLDEKKIGKPQIDYYTNVVICILFTRKRCSFAFVIIFFSLKSIFFQTIYDLKIEFNRKYPVR